jgi:predicted small lipoprotein YifL
MKKIIIFVLFVALTLTLAGCGSKELPFTNSPENNIKIDYMEDISQNKDKYEKMYMDYASMRIIGAMSEELEQFLMELEKKSTETVGKFTDNGDKFIVIQAIAEKNKESIEEGTKAMVDNYLRYSRLGDEEATEFGLSPELETQDPIGKVKKYMEDNNIKITEISLPEAFEQVDYDVYPIKFTYRYILKGTIGKKPFEKEVVQDFYVGIDWSKGKEKEKMRDVIEYIRDVKEEK